MSQEVIAELDKTIRLLEAEIPASLENPANQKVEAGLKRELQRYFRQLDQAIDWGALERIYYKNVKME